MWSNKIVGSRKFTLFTWLKKEKKNENLEKFNFLGYKRSEICETNETKKRGKHFFLYLWTKQCEKALIDSMSLKMNGHRLLYQQWFHLCLTLFLSLSSNFELVSVLNARYHLQMFVVTNFFNIFVITQYKQYM